MNNSPGPWRVSSSREGVVSSDGELVAALISSFKSREEFNANLNLIINAPKMLELLAKVALINPPVDSELIKEISVVLSETQGIK